MVEFNQINWPKFERHNLRDYIPNGLLCDKGLDLLEKMLIYAPEKRISASMAL